MSTTVLAPSGLEISSNHEDGQAMLDSLTKTPDKTPRVLVDKGHPVKPEGEEKDETQKAASVLGKKGGEAAAKAKKEAAKAKPADERPDAKEAKPADDKAKDAKAAKGKAEGADEDEEETDADGKPLGKPRDDPRARIRQLAEKAKAAEERAARAERERDEARRAAQPREERPAPERREAQPAKPAPDDDPEPQEGDFENYADFVKASSRWAARDEHRKVEAKTHLETARRSYVSAVQTDVDTFHERVTGLKKDDPGQGAAFAEFMDSLPEELLAPPSIMVPQGQRRQQNLIADIAMLSPKPREIYEYFADNMDDYQRIAALRTRDEIIAEMAIVKHRLDAATADTSSRREVSRAGSPPPSVRGTVRAVEPDLTGDLDFDEFQRRKRAAQK